MKTNQPSLWEDFHANHTHQPESDLAKRMIDISGRRCLELYARFSRHGLWAKTFSALLIGQTGWYSRRCNLTWKLKGTQYNRMFFQLQVSAHRTDETEFGLLLTPTTREEVQDVDKFKTRMEKYPNGTTMPNLATQVMGLLPTPKATEIEENYEDWKLRMQNSGNPKNVGKTTCNLGTMAVSGLLPTPKTQDSRHALKDRGKSNLGEEVSQWGQDNGIGSQLNPQFVAEMMGFPPNWLELPFQNTETNQ